jgi:hypothetical protein
VIGEAGGSFAIAMGGTRKEVWQLSQLVICPAAEFAAVRVLLQRGHLNTIMGMPPALALAS